MKALQVDNLDQYIVRLHGGKFRVVMGGETLEFHNFEKISLTRSELDTLGILKVSAKITHYESINAYSSDSLTVDEYNEKFKKLVSGATFDCDTDEYDFGNDYESEVQFRRLTKSYVARYSSENYWEPVKIEFGYAKVNTGEPYIETHAITRGKLSEDTLCDFNALGALHGKFDEILKSYSDRGIVVNWENSNTNGFRFLKIDGSYVFGDNDGMNPCNSTGKLSQLIGIRDNLLNRFELIVRSRINLKFVNVSSDFAEKSLDKLKTLKRYMDGVKVMSKSETDYRTVLKGMNEVIDLYTRYIAVMGDE